MKKNYEHWQDIYENGTHDSSYTDRFNLNLILIHINYDKQMIKVMNSEDTFREQYYYDLSLEVDQDYIAKSQEIIKKLETISLRMSYQLSMF